MWRLKRGRGTETSDDELRAQIDQLAAQNLASADRETERRLRVLRHEAGKRALAAGASEPRHPDPDAHALPQGDPLPEFGPDELTPELLRAAMLRDGCVLVRGLVDREAALELADGIDRAFAERERFLAGERTNGGYYEETDLLAQPEGVDIRPWVQQGGGVLAADSPLLLARMIDLFTRARLQELVGGYLGEQPLISIEKTTLRKADPAVSGAWHQDGKFMGNVRALNLWLSLSRCGDVAPGLDIVPKRLDYLVTAQTDEAVLDYVVSRSMVEEAAGDKPIVRPIFEPGDALLFDDLFLHSTGSDPAMPKPRFAVESWFFGASGFPGEYGALAV